MKNKINKNKNQNKFYLKPIKMIIPVRCFTCGKMLADKYYAYQEKMRGKKLAVKQDVDTPSIIDTNSDDIKKTPEGEALDEIGIIKVCCRKILLSHIDLIDEI